MTFKLLPVLLLVAHLAVAATPREFVADKVGDARSKLKAAEKKVDDLPALLAQAADAIGKVREKLKLVGPQLTTAQSSLETAQTNLKGAITANASMGEALKALPPPTPNRDALLKQNDEQTARLAAVDASLKTARASLADANQGFGDLDGKLKAIEEKLDGAKGLPSTKELNEVIDLMDAVLKVNKQAMPDFPNIKELK